MTHAVTKISKLTPLSISLIYQRIEARQNLIISKKQKIILFFGKPFCYHSFFEAKILTLNLTISYHNTETEPISRLTPN